MEGPGLDFLANPDGDMAVARKYMKRRLRRRAVRRRRDTLLMVGDDSGPDAKTARDRSRPS